MKKIFLLSVITLLSSAAAQQKTTFSPAIIDGVTTPNGLVIINGKAYISVDALKAGGVTVLKPNSSFGLYRFPNAQKQPLVLKGCINEWLFNGVDRLRIDSVGWNAEQSKYALHFTMQTPFSNQVWSTHFAEENAIVVYKSGKIVQPSKIPQQEITWDGNHDTSPRNDQDNTGTLWVSDPNDTGKDTLVKLVVPTGGGSDFGTNVMTFDLTCKK